MNETRASYIGLDFGGTKLLLGEMDESGKLLRTQRRLTGPMDQHSACRVMEEELAAFLAQKTENCLPRAIGIGLAAHVDNRSGTWLDTDRGRMEIIPLSDRIRERTHLNCYIDNDVKSAAKAEYLWGNCRGLAHFTYINVGTGIAACTVTDGRFVYGDHANAGEVGHISSGLERHFPACTRGVHELLHTGCVKYSLKYYLKITRSILHGYLIQCNDEPGNPINDCESGSK